MENSNSDNRFVEFLESAFKTENLEFEEGLQKLKDNKEFWDRTVGEYLLHERARLDDWHGTQDPRG